MENVEEVWAKIKEKLELRITSVSYSLWINPIKPLSMTDEELVLVAQSTSAKNQILRNFLDRILECFGELTEGKTIKITVLDPNEEIEYLEKNMKNTKEKEKTEEKSPFLEKFTFDNFVVGKSNQFVYAAARTVAEHPGERYNPLFIYGGVGLGKTHLLHAIGNYIHESYPTLKVEYATIRQFTNDYVNSLMSSSKTKSLLDFRGKYGNVDVLLVDDIQFISNKKETQEEFFHIFNDLIMNNKQVIICSDRPPKEIETLEERLRSRFVSGLIHDIQSPDIETRLAILRKKSQLEKYYAEEEVLNYIAERVDTNIRELEGKLREVYFLATLSGKKVATMEEARESFSNSEVVDTKETLTPEMIINTVCDYFNVSYKDIVGKKKTKEIVEPRMYAIYLIYDLLGLPLDNIGEIFGGRDHTTIMHSRNKITEELKSNKKTKTIIDEIKNQFKND